MKVLEAKKKICPFIAGVDHGGWSRNNGSPQNIKCICGDCMAWRYTNIVAVRFPKKCHNCNREWITESELKQHEGYCPNCGEEAMVEEFDRDENDKSGYCVRLHHEPL